MQAIVAAAASLVPSAEITMSRQCLEPGVLR
jgi:hypothetical protein